MVAKKSVVTYRVGVVEGKMVLEGKREVVYSISRRYNDQSDGI